MFEINEIYIIYLKRKRNFEISVRTCFIFRGKPVWETEAKILSWPAFIASKFVNIYTPKETQNIMHLSCYLLGIGLGQVEAVNECSASFTLKAPDGVIEQKECTPIHTLSDSEVDRQNRTEQNPCSIFLMRGKGGTKCGHIIQYMCMKGKMQ